MNRKARTYPGRPDQISAKTCPRGTCVTPGGRFVYGLHQPHFKVANLRESDHIAELGRTGNDRICLNQANFPSHDVEEPGAETIFEIPNPFPFRGVTFICKAWADQKVGKPQNIAIKPAPSVSLHRSLNRTQTDEAAAGLTPEKYIRCLPTPLQIALATVSTDPEDLVQLAGISCDLLFDEGSKRPAGIKFSGSRDGRQVPVIHNQPLFDAVANNPHLPDDYKMVMVLRPGIQGTSEIVGEWRRDGSHVFEYLRRNSYIPWGHSAANMAHDAIRYSVGALLADDVSGMRHLYYQRTYMRLAADMGLPLPKRRQTVTVADLEKLRRAIVAAIRSIDGASSPLPYSATLWGWNYGFDYAPTGYRLHASHQQIHQQFALIPERIPFTGAGGLDTRSAYACGDLIHDFVQTYRQQTGADFFDCYLQAIRTNQRLDGRQDAPCDLVVYSDDHVVLFVPKAQTSQWELQLMPSAKAGNILETDTKTRHALDKALLIATRILTFMGAKMITVNEYSKRFHRLDDNQRLLYTLLPRLPESPGAFSEAQLRWINGHYPEDFAQACRLRLDKALEGLTAS